MTSLDQGLSSSEARSGKTLGTRLHIMEDNFALRVSGTVFRAVGSGINIVRYILHKIA